MANGRTNGRVIQQQTQARDAGRRDERRRVEGGGDGKRPGGRRSVPGKEVGIGCNREVIRQQPLLMGGVSREGEIT